MRPPLLPHQSPNVGRLTARKMSVDTVPPGTPLVTGLVASIRLLCDRTRFDEVARSAIQWVTTVITGVREAAEPNPWKTADDEAIAGEILRQIKEREGGKRR